MLGLRPLSRILSTSLSDSRLRGNPRRPEPASAEASIIGSWAFDRPQFRKSTQRWAGDLLLEGATYRDLGVRHLTGDTHPDPEKKITDPRLPRYGVRAVVFFSGMSVGSIQGFLSCLAARAAYSPACVARAIEPQMAWADLG